MKRDQKIKLLTELANGNRAALDQLQGDMPLFVDYFHDKANNLYYTNWNGKVLNTAQFERLKNNRQIVFMNELPYRPAQAGASPDHAICVNDHFSKAVDMQHPRLAGKNLFFLPNNHRQ